MQALWVELQRYPARCNITETKCYAHLMALWQLVGNVVEEYERSL